MARGPGRGAVHVSDDTPVTPDAPDGTDSDHLDLHSEPEFAETRPVEQVPAWEADHPGQEPDEAIVTTRPQIGRASCRERV